MKLKTLYEQIIEKQSIEKKLNELTCKQEEIEKQIYFFEDKYKKEKYDVDCLENAGLKSFIFELLGNKEQKLEKERKEAYEVKMKLDSYKNQYSTIVSDIKYYEKKLDDIYNCEDEYKRLYDEKKNSLLDNSEIIEIENRISDVDHQLKEINEAVIEAKKALNISDRTVENLDSANNWATYDMISKGGLISHSLKYEALDKAQENIEQLQIQLNRLKIELVDIQVSDEIKISIDSFDRTLDFWFDNIFTDYSIKDKIGQALEQAKNTNSRLKTIINKLDNMFNEQTKIKNNLQNELDKIVINA